LYDPGANRLPEVHVDSTIQFNLRHLAGDPVECGTGTLAGILHIAVMELMTTCVSIVLLMYLLRLNFKFKFKRNLVDLTLSDETRNLHSRLRIARKLHSGVS
jgi:hypothetical protein